MNHKDDWFAETKLDALEKTVSRLSEEVKTLSEEKDILLQLVKAFKLVYAPHQLVLFSRDVLEGTNGLTLITCDESTDSEKVVRVDITRKAG